MAKFTVVVHELGRKAATMQADSLEEISDLVVNWQSSHGLGASDLTGDHGKVFEGPKPIARISYNGRIWPL